MLFIVYVVVSFRQKTTAMVTNDAETNIQIPKTELFPFRSARIGQNYLD